MKLVIIYPMIDLKTLLSETFQKVSNVKPNLCSSKYSIQSLLSRISWGTFTNFALKITG